MTPFRYPTPGFGPAADRNPEELNVAAGEGEAAGHADPARDAMAA